MPLHDPDRTAIDRCVESNYAALRSAAHWELKKESPSFSINSDDLVHLAYQSLADRSALEKLEAGHLIRQFRLVMHNICRNRRRARASRRIRNRKHTDARERQRAQRPSDHSLDTYLGLIPARHALVANLYARGSSVATIANLLSLSARTIERDLAAVADGYMAWCAEHLAQPEGEHA